MKRKKNHKFSASEDVVCSDSKIWMKQIQAEIQHIRHANAIIIKKNSSASSELLDLTPAMEKRRIAALLSSLENLDEQRKQHADAWITLNIFSDSYAPMQCGGHVLTAAAIWILDKLTACNTPLEKIVPLLPEKETLLPETLLELDFWDSQYDKELIAKVEYVLTCRNQDIAPLENNGIGGVRGITSSLAAERKDIADVPSRKNFETLLSLLPQQVKEEAARRFENCYQVWTNRFFSGIICLQEQYLEKIEELDRIHRETQEIHDKLEEKEKNMTAFMKSSGNLQKKNVTLMHVVQPKEENASLSPLFHSAVSSFLLNSKDGLYWETNNLFLRFSELSRQHDKAEKEFQEIMKKREQFMAILTHYGYFTEKFVKENFPEELHESLLKPLPITDPYEMCFALLYLVETGSEIPWLYGSCIGTMAQVTASLPWGLSDYCEQEDPYWKESLPVSTKIPDFPDWYARNYIQKGQDEYYTKSLAQIVYETTGCLMPRNLHRYDAELKNLGKYGIRQNKAVAVLYCMLTLGYSRRQILSDNLQKFIPAEKEQNQEHLPVEETKNWNTQKAELEKEIQQLRSALYQAEKSVENAKKKLEQQKAEAEAEHRELADLREIVFNQEVMDCSKNETETAIDNKIYPYTVQKNTVIFGGHETWMKSIKPLLKGNIKFIAKEVKVDVSLIRYADVIWIQTNAISHASYYVVVTKARKLGKPIRYFTNASATKCVEQIVENDRKR